MDTLKYKAIIKAVETGSITGAAKALQYTPSGINRMINSLEEELGFEILTRTNKGVHLTKEGKKILPAFFEIISAQEKLRQVSAEIKENECGEITIGTIYSIASAFLPEIIKKFKEKHPQITINIIENSRRKLLNLLENNSLDLCFISDGENCEQWLPLLEDDIVVWTPSDYKTPSNETFAISDIEKYPLIYTLHDKNTDTGRIFEKHNITPNIQYYTDDNYTSYKMVEAGLGISLNNSLMTKDWRGNVKILKLFPPCKITLGIAYNKKKLLMPAIKKFINCAKMYIK